MTETLSLESHAWDSLRPKRRRIQPPKRRDFICNLNVGRSPRKKTVLRAV